MAELKQRPANSLRLSSPRSLTACKHEGINPHDLVFRLVIITTDPIRCFSKNTRRRIKPHLGSSSMRLNDDVSQLIFRVDRARLSEKVDFPQLRIPGKSSTLNSPLRTHIKSKCSWHTPYLQTEICEADQKVFWRSARIDQQGVWDATNSRIPCQ